jgi:hypothetical protein
LFWNVSFTSFAHQYAFPFICFGTFPLHHSLINMHSPSLVLERFLFIIRSSICIPIHLFRTLPLNLSPKVRRLACKIVIAISADAPRFQEIGALICRFDQP